MRPNNTRPLGWFSTSSSVKNLPDVKKTSFCILANSKRSFCSSSLAFLISLRKDNFALATKANGRLFPFFISGLFNCFLISNRTSVRYVGISSCSLRQVRPPDNNRFLLRLEAEDSNDNDGWSLLTLSLSFLNSGWCLMTNMKTNLCGMKKWIGDSKQMIG